MKKIKFTELTNITFMEDPEKIKYYSNWNVLYTAIYKNKVIVVKAQKINSLSLTNSLDDRFIQEKDLCKNNSPYLVTCYGWGDDFYGERFLVYERLFPIPLSINKKEAQNIANCALLASRQLYLLGFNWMSCIKHVMINQENCIKIIDFNDDHMPLKFFGDTNKYTDCESIFLDLSVRSTEIISVSELKNKAWDNLVEKEYFSLENVHQPIYLPKYSEYLRRETEISDPKYNQAVIPNRKCVDRAKILDSIPLNDIKTCLDIGGNIGWFCFYLNEKYGIKTHCIDFDKPGNTRPEGWNKKLGGKIEFAKLLNNSYIKAKNIDFSNIEVTPEYMNRNKSYDMILVLSLLHLFFSQHNVSIRYWNDLFISIAKKANKILIIEVAASLYTNLGMGSYENLATYLCAQGKFSKYEIKGISDSNRPFIIFYR